MKGRANHMLNIWRGEGSKSRDRFVLNENYSCCCYIEVRLIDTLGER